MPSSRITPCAKPRCRQGIWDSSGNQRWTTSNSSIFDGKIMEDHPSTDTFSWRDWKNPTFWEPNHVLYWKWSFASEKIEFLRISGLTFAQHLADRSDSNGSAEASTQPSFNHQWRHRSSKLAWGFSTQLALGIIIIHYGKPYSTTSMREWQRVLNTTPIQPKCSFLQDMAGTIFQKAIPLDLVIDDFLNKTRLIQKFQLPCLIIGGYIAIVSLYLYIFWLYPHETIYIFVGYWDGFGGFSISQRVGYPLTAGLVFFIRPYLMLCWAPLEALFSRDFDWSIWVDFPITLW